MLLSWLLYVSYSFAVAVFVDVLKEWEGDVEDIEGDVVKEEDAAKEDLMLINKLLPLINLS